MAASNKQKVVTGNTASNNISPVIVYQPTKSISFMWMGDMETAVQEEFEKECPNLHVSVLFAPHHGRKSGHVPKKLLEKLYPSIIVVGEAPSEELDYYSEYITITQNSAGNIKFETSQEGVDVYVSNKLYNKKVGSYHPFKQGVDKRYLYIGTI